MKRLLFVDDEAMVLSGLRRSLHGMRNLWDMQFVESAAAALQALEKERYDAIISDYAHAFDGWGGPCSIRSKSAIPTWCA